MSDLSINSLARLSARARLSERAVLSAAREMVARFRALCRDGHGHLPRFAAESIDDHYPSLTIVNEVRD